MAKIVDVMLTPADWLVLAAQAAPSSKVGEAVYIGLYRFVTDPDTYVRHVLGRFSMADDARRRIMAAIDSAHEVTANA